MQRGSQVRIRRVTRISWCSNIAHLCKILAVFYTLREKLEYGYFILILKLKLNIEVRTVMSLFLGGSGLHHSAQVPRRVALFYCTFILMSTEFLFLAGINDVRLFLHKHRH